MDAIKDTQTAEFKAPQTKEDFPQGTTAIEHTYPNGNKVVWLLLKDERVARIREGSGEDVELAEMEAGSNADKAALSMMAATITIDGKSFNMYELPKTLKMRDYLTVKAEFAKLNFQ